VNRWQKEPAVYLRVCPDSLDTLADGLVGLSGRLPAPAAVGRDLESIGACLPGFAASTRSGGGALGPSWAQALGELEAALSGQARRLGSAAAAYRWVDGDLRR